VRHHLGIAQDRRALCERGACCGDQPGAEHDILGYFDAPAGMDHAHGDLGLFGREARQIGFGADDGEGALVDRGAVAQIVMPLSHG